MISWWSNGSLRNKTMQTCEKVTCMMEVARVHQAAESLTQLMNITISKECVPSVMGMQK